MSAKSNKCKVKNCYLVFVKEQRPTIKANYPSLTPVEITKKISEEWQKLTEDENNSTREKQHRSIKRKKMIKKKMIMKLGMLNVLNVN